MAARNPSLAHVAEALRRLEGGEAGRVLSSGMAALSTTMLGLLRAGDQVVAVRDLSPETAILLERDLPRLGVTPCWVPADRSDDVRSYIGARTRLLLLETPTNPGLRVHDIGRWARAAREAGARLVVDNTLATPVNQNPLRSGADLVLHSATKALGGHSDLTAGAVVGHRRLVEQLDPFGETLGGRLDPLAAFLLARGIRTLPLRVRRQNENGRVVVQELGGHPKLDGVLYPGRGSRAQERICRWQMRGRTGMVGLLLRGGHAAGRRFLASLRLVQPASSLGGVESVASMPWWNYRPPTGTGTGGAWTAEHPEGLVRLSLGIEDPSDLLADIRGALTAT